MENKDIIRIPRNSVEHCAELLKESGKNTKKIVLTILENWLEISRHTPDRILSDESQQAYEGLVYMMNLYVADVNAREDLIKGLDDLLDTLGF